MPYFASSFLLKVLSHRIGNHWSVSTGFPISRLRSPRPFPTPSSTNLNQMRLNARYHKRKHDTMLYYNIKI